MCFHSAVEPPTSLHPPDNLCAYCPYAHFPCAYAILRTQSPQGPAFGVSRARSERGEKKGHDDKKDSVQKQRLPLSLISVLGLPAHSHRLRLNAYLSLDIWLNSPWVT